MGEFLIYTLKVGICLAVFYLFFKLLLARETYHRLNRILILSAVVLSFLLPVCVITIKREIVLPEMTSLVVNPTGILSETNEPVVWLTILGVVYILGVVFSLGSMCWSLIRLQKVFRQGERKELEGGMHLILMDDKTAPFSWGKYIVMSREDWELAGSTVLLHEQAHIRLHHTWDLMLTDILGAAQWFNPAMMLLRQELRGLHEYEADAEVLRSGVAPKDYQLLLIRKAVGGRWYSVANSFNHNNLKKRINMMLQKKSSRMARAKSLLVLPLLCTAVLAFAETKYVPVENKDSETSQNVAKSSEDKVLVLVNGKIVQSLDLIDQSTIKSMTIIKDKKQMEQYGNAAKGKDKVIVITLKDGVETPQDLKNCLFVVDGKIVESIDNITAEMIESMTVIKDKKQMKKYGKATKGKDGVIEVKLRKNSDSGKELQLNGETSSLQIQTDGGKVLKVKGNISVRTQNDGDNILYVVDGKVVESIDDITVEMIESMTVIKDKENMKKYGKAAKGKDGVIDIKLRSNK